MSSVSLGAASQSEGQRLLAQRRGPMRLWIQAHPLAVNVILALTNLVYLFAVTLVFLTGDDEGVTIMPSDQETAYFVPVSLLLTLGVFYRSRYPALLLLSAVCANLLQVIIQGDIAINEVKFSSVSGITLLIFLYTLAYGCSWRHTLLVFLICLVIDGITVITGVYHSLFFFEDGTVDESPYALMQISIITSSILLRVSVGLVVILIAHQVRRNRDFEAELLATFEKNQQLAATEERNRIAREMHDVVAHSLTVMITLADGTRIVAKKDPQRAEEVLSKLSETGRAALADIRRTLGVLRGTEGESAPLNPVEGRAEDAVENLAELVTSFASTGLPVQFHHEGQDIPDDHNLRLSIYRIVQESLTNALRYGENVRSVKVLLRVELPDIWIRVVNDGTTVNSSRRRGEPSSGLGSGKGIAGMRERAAFYGGSVEAGENSGGGWTVLAHLLWQG